MLFVDLFKGADVSKYKTYILILFSTYVIWTWHGQLLLFRP